MSIDHHNAEDLTQNVLLKVYENIEKYEYTPSIHASVPGYLRYAGIRSWISSESGKQTRRKLFSKSSSNDSTEVEELADAEWKARNFNSLGEHPKRFPW